MTIFYVGDDAECKKFLARIPLIPINLVVTNREEDIVLQIKRAQPDVIFCDLSSQRSGGRDLLIRLRTEPETSLSMIIADLVHCCGRMYECDHDRILEFGEPI